MSLFVTGSIGIDTVEAPSGTVHDALGGSCIYFSQAASFFSPVRLVGAVGEDCPPDFLKPMHDNPLIDTAGVEVREGSKTFRWHGRYHDDVNQRDTVGVELGVVGEHVPEIPEQFRDSEYVFLANTHPSQQRQLLEKLTSPKLVVADTMDLWIHNEPEALAGLLGHIDALVLNDSEAKLLTQKTNVVLAGLDIARQVRRFVVVKKGEHGSILFMDGKAYPVPGYPATEVVDPTGAGDSFAGAMMGHLAAVDRVDADTLRTAIAYGTITASFELEDFSLRKLLVIDRADIDARLEQFRGLTGF